MNNSLATGDCANRTPAIAGGRLSPRRCAAAILIIEDEALVAQNLADLVTDAGFLALGPVASASEVARVLDQGRVRTLPFWTSC